jgi:mono/diheme cytochrome c family protein
MTPSPRRGFRFAWHSRRQGVHRATRVVAALAVLLPAATSVAASLEFRRPGQPSRSLEGEQLASLCPAQTIELDDPYYERRMRYHAWPLRCVLTAGFGVAPASLPGPGLLLRARDGYTRPASLAQLLEDGGFLAFADATLDATQAGGPASRFSPIDRRQVDPGPFYLVWTGAARSDPHTHPWPYQLAVIEAASFEAAFPHTVPEGLPAADAGWSGYRVFQASCASCHAINGEGGRVGPELNVPRSIVEYRPAEQIKAYVRDPASFRYTSMPAHPDLSSEELDSLIAYFRAMSERKHDPRRKAAHD